MNDKSRLRWRCRRGTLELDLVLGRFLEQGYDSLSADERTDFERLLDCEDDQLQSWMFGDGKPTDGKLERLIERILATS